jgi:hypothetical protein
MEGKLLCYEGHRSAVFLTFYPHNGLWKFSDSNHILNLVSSKMLLGIFAFMCCSLAFVQFIYTFSEITVCMWFPAAWSLKSFECVMCPYSDTCSDGTTSVKGDKCCSEQCQENMVDYEASQYHG